MAGLGELMHSGRLSFVLIFAIPLLARSHVVSCAQSLAAPTSETPNTTISSSTSLVSVDVVVTSKGEAQTELAQAKFHVFEDGRPQAIIAFDEHRRQSDRPAEHTPRAAPDSYTNEPEYSEESSPTIVLLDSLNTSFADQMQARSQMQRFPSQLPANTPLAIFTLGSRLRLVKGLGSNHTELNDGSNARPSPLLMGSPESQLDSSISDLSTLGAAQAVRSMQQFEADNTAMSTDQRVRLTLTAMQEIARYSSAVPSRKNLLWFSGSFPLQLDADISLDTPLDSTRNYSEELRETSHLLSAARVAVYPVDARGLQTLPMVDGNYSESSSINPAGTGGGPTAARHGTLASGSPGFAKDNMRFMKQTHAENASMVQVAMDTGGWAFVDSNDLLKSADRALRHGSQYYTITYRAPDRALDGKFHKIAVHVDGGKYQLAYRTGYYADDPAKRLAFRSTESSLVAAAAHGAPPSTEIIFTLHLTPVNADVTGATQVGGTIERPSRRALIRKPYLLSFAVDGKDVEMVTLPDGSRTARIEFAALAYSRDGKLINRSDQGYAFHLTADQYQRVTQRGISQTIQLDLPSDPLFLRVMVHDLNSNRLGAAEFPFTVADRDLTKR